MAVTTIREFDEGRRSWRDAQGRHHRRVFRVTTSSTADGSAAVLAASDSGFIPSSTPASVKIPKYGDAHPDKDGTFVAGVDAVATNESAMVFVATVTYGEPADEQTDPDPLARPAIVRVEYQEAQETYFFDAAGVPVVNSQGLPFDELPTRDGAQMIVVVEKNRSIRNMVVDDGLKNSTNAQSVVIDGTTFAAGVLLMGPIQSRKVFESGVTYYAYTYRMKVNADGWNQVFRDETYHGITAEGDPIELTLPNDKGKPQAIRKPWPLNGAGSLKANYTDEPAQIERTPYKSTSSWPDFL